VFMIKTHMLKNNSEEAYGGDPQKVSSLESGSK
jgi:hypothetical protein